MELLNEKISSLSAKYDFNGRIGGYRIYYAFYGFSID